MLSLEKCREILGCDSSESNEELERLRDSLYGVARVAVEVCPRQQAFHGVAKVEALSKSTGFPYVLAMLPEEGRYNVEERAAIMEFDGGLDRDVAERAAFSSYWRERHEGN